MSKSVKFQRPKAPTVENWVKEQPKDAEGVRMRRLTVPVPDELHRRIKLWCVTHDRIMSEAIMELLEREFPVGRK